MVAVAAIGFGIVICEGWPSMGSDFGGVIALTPPVLWLLLVLSGVRITWPRLLALGGAAVVAIGLISVLDWLRGPDRRSHLGNFVQRILDGDALDVVARKAVASWTTIADPLGIVRDRCSGSRSGSWRSAAWCRGPETVQHVWARSCTP